MYRHQHNASAGGAEQYQYQFSASSNQSFNYSPYTSVPGMMGGFHGSPHLSPRNVIAQPRHDRHSSVESQIMRPPSASSRFGSQTPVNNAVVHFIPTDRSLPSKDVTQETIPDAYVAFILYCNPNFSLDVDTSTLRTNVQNPPKSDNKDFEIFRLYELIQKFDSKEIKTWAALALDLGVEAPDVSKGQSAQKVQQYSVRLKRWMRAMHVDAFFEYLLGKHHVYYSEIPHPSDPFPSAGRDGVPAEEDLAIRALDPAFRPKRGRRRNSEAEQEAEAEREREAANKQARMMDQTPHGVPNSGFPGSTLTPFTAQTDRHNDPWAVASAVTPQTFAPWATKSAIPQSAIPQSAITATTPSNLRWQLHGNTQEIVSPHPMSAYPGSMAAHIEAAFDNEPKSAVTPSTRKRRKHGPAVSSAWPSANAAGAKPRGRPPASRNVQDGPFNTFPADPANEKATNPTFTAPAAPMELPSAVEEPIVAPARPLMTGRHSDGPMRPGRLSLQVPQHKGGPVRLATPPTVLLNGETNHADLNAPASIVESPQEIPQMPPERVRVMAPANRDIPGFAFEALKRVLASDLLRAEIVGRRQRLTSDEAKRLADAVLERFKIPRLDTEKPRDDIARLTAASWLGVGDQLNVPLGPAVGQNKKITVTCFRLDSDGYEEIVSGYDDNPRYDRELFDLFWVANMFGCMGTFELKGLSLASPEPEEPDIPDVILDTFTQTAKMVGMEKDDMERIRQKMGTKPGASRVPGDENADWKARYRQLEFGAKMAKGESFRIKQRIIEKVLQVMLD